jgi:hypothetical protein
LETGAASVPEAGESASTGLLFSALKGVAEPISGAKDFEIE